MIDEDNLLMYFNINVNPEEDLVPRGTVSKIYIFIILKVSRGLGRYCTVKSP